MYEKMNVRRPVCVRLKPTAVQRAALLETLRLSTVCFNAVAEYAWQHEQRNSVELHKATYSALRRQHPTVPSQLVVSARRRAAEAITSALLRKAHGKRVCCPRGVLVPVRRDARSYRMVTFEDSGAGLNARRNIAAKHGWGGMTALGGPPVNWPIVGEPGEVQHASTGKPPALAGGG
jgi:predicted transposase